MGNLYISHFTQNLKYQLIDLVPGTTRIPDCIWAYLHFKYIQTLA